MLNWPLIAGLNVIDVSWLPGFNGVDVSWGIWFVYAGLILGIITTGYYIAAALKELKAARSKESS